MFKMLLLFDAIYLENSGSSNCHSVQSMWAERKTEKTGPKIGWRGAGVAENDGMGVEHEAGSRGAGMERAESATHSPRSNLIFTQLTS